MYLDVHVVQSIPFANLNRDDLGSPKTVFYGGGTRTRVSSQCWKRAVRLAMEERLGDPAMRTRRLASLVSKALRDAGWQEELAAFAGGQVVTAAKGKEPLKLEENGGTSVLLYLPRAAVGRLTSLCEEHREALVQAAAAAPAKGKAKAKAATSVLPTEAVNEIVTSRNGIINLFGRMLAELPGGRVDGAVQVAHAFTTHNSEPEVDFFTAVDDVAELATDAGSGHMNAAEFSAGVFYRYASINIAELHANLDGDAAQARELVEAFCSALIESLPGAKKNSTAPFTIPDLVYVAVRRDRPVSLASAFESPVRPALDGGCSEPSRRALADYTGQVYKLIGTDGLAHHAYAEVGVEKRAALGVRAESFRELVGASVEAAFGEGKAS
ncbi:type I-E CRISPR-associated protein Cas7/Cse4/CasC [Actinomadura sp. DC4]|uniref:type I-E CRISPR-associated protein Cas7/Cse4/CasC n=1 Tax=Actinomadura sp. DC4 TaxID=3055069 RepID=UPI0025B03935|nr:type I-E CRISPR-associated protein Cas7/Cse4/CasC [Actinomadura sp. DC4]MDN3355838.1 type I-E CRISPR-associated protein Cas7/Cse4/CasC [Actinomadura sp. DC4]